MGKAGAGKSTLVNNLLDAPLAKIGEGTTGTFNIDTYKLHKYGYEFIIYDTPGFFDEENNIDIAKEIGSIQKINIVLLCYDLNQPRLYQDDLNTFSEIKKNYGNDILKHSILVFTKSNLVKNLEFINKTRYDKININIPMANAYDNTTELWREKLWYIILLNAKNPDYMIQANYIRFTLCDPLKKIIENVQQNGLYPTNTQEKINKEYEICVKNKYDESIKNGLTWGLLSLVGTIVLGVATGGASLMATLATFGFGSLASGGIGVAGGSIILPALGFASGVAFTQLNDIDCKQKIENNLINIINAEHHDTYKYKNGKIAFAGNFINNLPCGQGMSYDENDKLLWNGWFDDGIAEICANIIV